MSAEADAILPFAICQELGLSVGYERSVKIREGQVLANRYLIGIPTEKLSVATARGIGSRLRIPEDSERSTVDRSFWDLYAFANLLLIGYEDREPGSTFKLYLEFDEQVLSPTGESSPLPQDAARLLHRGIKWTPSSLPRGLRLSNYVWQPGLDATSIRRRVLNMVGGTPIEGDLITMLDRILERCPAAQLRYVVVDEGDRRSFDLNCYAASLTVGEVFAACRAVAASMGVVDRMDLLEPLVSGALLGHLAAGVDGAGDPFMTVYYEPPG